MHCVPGVSAQVPMLHSIDPPDQNDLSNAWDFEADHSSRECLVMPRHKQMNEFTAHVANQRAQGNIPY
jgi:hypothetical protein